MSDIVLNVGQHQHHKKTLSHALASIAFVSALALGGLSITKSSPVQAGGETRTISLKHIHTGETLTVTYKKDGRYVPSAMARINHLLRDWRRNETITVDPRTIDLVWELHADLGSKAPINIVCGYRSPRTNAFLKRIGRRVATKSQHMRGKAIDFFFPDVPTKKIRNSALARQVGGVGYYSSAGGPTGFLHADSGNVRHWGPGMAPSQMAGLIAEGKKYVGKRLNRPGYKQDQMMLAQAADETGGKTKPGNLLDYLMGKDGAAAAPDEADLSVAQATTGKQPQPAAPDYANGDDEELANLSADAASTEAAAETATKKVKLDDPAEPVAETVETPAYGQLAALANTASLEKGDDATVKNGVPATLPRLKPAAKVAEARNKALQQMASADVNIVPASATPEQTWQHKPSRVASKLAAIDPALAALEQADNGSTKTSLPGPKVKVASLVGASMIPGITIAYQAEGSTFTPLKGSLAGVLPQEVKLGPDGSGVATSLEPLRVAEGKGDSLIVNRDGKTSMPATKIRFSESASGENQ